MNKKFLKENIKHIVDILILLFSIVLTLHIESKFNNYSLIKNYYWYILIILGSTVIGLTIYKIKLEKKEKDIEEENKKLTLQKKYLEDLIASLKYQISKPLEDFLHNVSIRLSLNERHRITVYTYTNGCFFSIARYSKNPSYNKFGRISIDDKSEFLFKVWNGEEKCQSIKVSPERNMPTQKICAHFLYEKNHEHPGKDKIGLVVFESTSKKNKNFNNGKFAEEVTRINEFIQSSMNIKQDLKLAMKEGL